jgi:hypothetical protein
VTANALNFSVLHFVPNRLPPSPILLITATISCRIHSRKLRRRCAGGSESHIRRGPWGGWRNRWTGAAAAAHGTLPAATLRAATPPAFCAFYTDRWTLALLLSLPLTASHRMKPGIHIDVMKGGHVHIYIYILRIYIYIYIYI